WGLMSPEKMLAGFSLYRSDASSFTARVVMGGGVSEATTPVIAGPQRISPVKHGSVYRVMDSNGKAVQWLPYMPVGASTISRALVLANSTGSPCELFRIAFIGDPTKGVIRLDLLDGKDLYYDPQSLPCAWCARNGSYVLIADNTTQHDLRFQLKWS